MFSPLFAGTPSAPIPQGRYGRGEWQGTVWLCLGAAILSLVPIAASVRLLEAPPRILAPSHPSWGPVCLIPVPANPFQLCSLLRGSSPGSRSLASAGYRSPVSPSSSILHPSQGTSAIVPAVTASLERMDGTEWVPQAPLPDEAPGGTASPWLAAVSFEAADGRGLSPEP